MQRSAVIALASALAVASSLCAPGVGRTQTTYTLTQVGPNDPVSNTTVTGMNDEGDLVLTVNNGPTVSTYLWSHGAQTNIGGLTASPEFVESGGLSDLARIVGTTLCPTSGSFCGFVWSQGQMTALPTPAGTTASFAIQINLLGQIVGQVYDANFNAHAALWNRGTANPILLPGIAGGSASQPVGINLRGEIAGSSQDASNVTSTVIWRQGALTVLINNSAPSAINDEGQIVGTLFGEPERPFLWQNGTTTQLPPLPGLAATGTASGINDWGQIVGEMNNVPILWQNGVAIDLNSQIASSDPLQPYVRLQAASRINNLGQIVANGADSRNPGVGQWYLLTPVR
jgi:uncharacterized membrane protein